MITIDLLLHAQAVSNMYKPTRASRVFAKAIKEMDAGNPLSDDLVVSIKSCVNKVKFADKTNRLYQIAQEWNKQ